MHTWTSSFWLTSRELRSVFLLCEGFSLGGESAAERGPGRPRAERKAGRGQRMGVAAGAGGHRDTRAAAPHGRNPRVRAHLEALGRGAMMWGGTGFGAPSCTRVVSEAHRGGQELPGDLGALSPSLPGAPQGTLGWTWRRRVWMCWFERQQLEAR